MARQSKSEVNAESIKLARRAYLSRPHQPKPRSARGAEPKAQPKGEGGNGKKTTVTTGKTAAASKKGS